MYESMPEGEAMWDVVTGVSVGAINGCGIGVFKPGLEDEATDFLRKFSPHPNPY